MALHDDTPAGRAAAMVREAARQGESDGRFGYPVNPGDFTGRSREAYIEAHREAAKKREA